MNLSKVVRIYFLVASVVIGGLSAKAAGVPIRQSSDNGTPTNAVTWNLLGRTVPVTLTGNGKSITMRREVICPQQDVASSKGDNSAAGGCSSGEYLLLYQILSNSKNVTLELSGLEAGTFSKVGGNGSGTYGVMICDDANNDAELCTEDSESPGYTNLEKITFAVKGSTSVSFTIPSFPTFSAGENNAEGQGLTLFIVTRQSAPLPISFPTVSVQ